MTQVSRRGSVVNGADIRIDNFADRQGGSRAVMNTGTKTSKLPYIYLTNKGLLLQSLASGLAFRAAET